MRNLKSLQLQRSRRRNFIWHVFCVIFPDSEGYCGSCFKYRKRCRWRALLPDVWPCALWSLGAGATARCVSVSAAGCHCQMCGCVRFELGAATAAGHRPMPTVLLRRVFGAWVLRLLEDAAECRCHVLPTKISFLSGVCAGGILVSALKYIYIEI